MELIPLANFPGVKPNQKYIIRAHPSGDISPPIGLGGEDMAMVDLALEVKGWGILSAYPLLSSSASSTASPSPEVEIAVLGLLSKMTGAAAILGAPQLTTSPPEDIKLSITLKALGILGIYISTLEDMSASDGKEGEEEGKAEGWKNKILVLIKERVVPIETVRACGKVLEIDVEAAWKEMGLEAGWGNEVEVIVMVSG